MPLIQAYQISSVAGRDRGAITGRPYEPLSASGSALERKMEMCECMIDIVAALFNVSGKELRSPGRSALGISRVRHIAMYVTHVVLGLTMNEVGRGFARDRTTVLHACHLVEDMRDDPDFDAIVLMTERVARAALRRGENG